jgi:hypothetical protein
MYWLPTVIPATHKTEIRKIVVQNQLKQKVSKIPISTNKLGIMVPSCHPSRTEAVSRKIIILG